jgi:hypothetical protein
VTFGRLSQIRSARQVSEKSDQQGPVPRPSDVKQAYPKVAAPPLKDYSAFYLPLGCPNASAIEGLRSAGQAHLVSLVRGSLGDEAAAGAGTGNDPGACEHESRDRNG